MLKEVKPIFTSSITQRAEGFPIMMNDRKSHSTSNDSIYNCTGVEAKGSCIYFVFSTVSTLYCAGVSIAILYMYCVDSTFWILRSMLSGRLKRNLKRCRTLSALRVESALSFRPKTSWNRVSAVSLAPTRNTERARV